MNLLIVEDHTTSRKLLRAQLEAEGHAVTEAANGEDALDILKQQDMDGVVSDILMPGMDGFRLCYEVRKGATAQRRIPLVLYSAMFFAESDRQLARSVGADGLIRKPASVAVILATLRQAAARQPEPGERHPAQNGEEYVLERYNAVLVRQLQARASELQQALAQTHRAHEEILELNRTLETRISQRTAALEAANAEMEAISRTVARDLRPPLQSICSSAQRLATSETPAREDLLGIINAARRMNELVETLSEFLRLGHAPLNRVMLDLDTLVNEAIAALDTEVAGRSIQWERRDLTYAYGDPALLRQVFVTLIRNSAKYTRGRSPAVIEIGCRNGRANELVTYVRDNGLGHDTLSMSAASPDNDQLGLATLQRIVARHGGRMWSDATPGVGASFFFSIPRENGQDTDHRR